MQTPYSGLSAFTAGRKVRAWNIKESRHNGTQMIREFDAVIIM